MKETPEERLIFEIVHDLEKMAPHFTYIDNFIRFANNDCVARNAFKQIQKIYDKIMSEGCKSIRRAFHE